jgi:predicted nucleic acid-binding protein
MSRAVLNSSVIIALSTLGYLDKIKQVFKHVLIAKSVYEEVCIKGRGLTGEKELLARAMMSRISLFPKLFYRLSSYFLSHLLC